MIHTDYFLGGTKQAEYKRSIELFNDIYKTKGLYFALALLYDSQYDRKDIKAMLDILEIDVRKNKI